MKQFFEGYGWLDWLEPKDFWADSWSVYETVINCFDEEYDIVIRDGKFRYTNI